MADPKYIDFHCHPGLKTFLSGPDNQTRTTCWDQQRLVGFYGGIGKIAMGNMFNSNSSLTQLKEGNVSIAVVGLYAYERTMITGKLDRPSGSELNILKISETFGRRNRKRISHECLKEISSNRNNYFDLFNDVQEHLLGARSQNNQRTYYLLNKISDYKADELNIILSIEGGHNLLSNLPGSNSSRRSILENLRNLKSQRERRYLFLGLAHLEYTDLCNHAYGMKIIDDPRFRPSGNGISRLGKAVIKEALKEDTYRMLIDVKHMSLKARLQYYDMVRRKKEKIPIIMSHAGVTGRSYKQMPVKSYKQYCRCWYEVEYNKPAGIMGTEFNPWSINLYDEEIPIIVKSGGIIGINLDERILGTGKPTPEHLTEYFSGEEIAFCEPKFKKGMKYENQRAAKSNHERKRSHHRDIKHICNTILHIVKKGGKKAWKHICIGSDFDGLVNPVEYFHTSREFGRLSKALEEWLPKMAEHDKSYVYNIRNIKEKVEGIMFQNAWNFLNTNFQ